LTSTFPRCYNVEVKVECSCGAVGILKKEEKEEERNKIEIGNRREVREREKEKASGQGGRLLASGPRSRPESATPPLKPPLGQPFPREKETKVHKIETRELPTKASLKIEKKSTFKCGAFRCQKKPQNSQQGLKIKTKAGEKIILTERDIAILKEINRYGFLGVDEIMQIFRMSVKIVYFRLKKMVEAGLLKHERILHAYPGVYWLTFAGKGACNSNLSTISSPSVGTFAHDISLARLYLSLRDRYGEKLVSWATPRELRANKFNLCDTLVQGFAAVKSHTPDGLLVLNGEAGTVKAALELELSAKSTPRLKSIIGNYANGLRGGQVNRVIYYCGDDAIKRRVMEAVRTSDAQGLFHVTVVQNETSGLKK
jgi:hypothetical protein